MTDHPPQVMTIKRFKELREVEMLEKLQHFDCSVEALLEAYPDVIRRIKAQQENK